MVGANSGEGFLVCTLHIISKVILFALLLFVVGCLETARLAAGMTFSLYIIQLQQYRATGFRTNKKRNMPHTPTRVNDDSDSASGGPLFLEF